MSQPVAQLVNLICQECSAHQDTECRNWCDLGAQLIKGTTGVDASLSQAMHDE